VIDRHRAAGARRSLLAVVMAAALLIFVACSGDDDKASTSPTTSTSTSTTAAPGVPDGAVATPMKGLTVGQCFVIPIDDAPADGRAVWVVDCSQPHTHEIYDIVDYAGPTVKGDEYPGVAAVQAWSEQSCHERFEAFAGIPWTRSSLEIQVWWPSTESWPDDDRSVICTAFPQSEERVTGSQRGKET